MFNFVVTEKLWHPSRHAEIPAVPWGEHDTVVDLFLVAGGLALILSRCTETLIKQEFAATHALYETLRTQLRRQGGVEASSEVISEAMHEVSEHADPGTRNALKRCLEARVKFEFTQAAAAREEKAPQPAFFLDSAVGDGKALASAEPVTTKPAARPSSVSATPAAADPILPQAQRLRAKVEEARQRRDGARAQRQE